MFQHPAQWNPAKVVASGRLRNCRLGWECTFRGCFYTHPEGRAIDDNAEIVGGEVEEPVLEVQASDEMTAKSFKLRRQSEKELARQIAETEDVEAVRTESSKATHTHAADDTAPESEVEVEEAPKKKKNKRQPKEQHMDDAEAEVAPAREKKQKKHFVEREDQPPVERKKKGCSRGRG